MSMESVLESGLLDMEFSKNTRIDRVSSNPDLEVKAISSHWFFVSAKAVTIIYVIAFS